MKKKSKVILVVIGVVIVLGLVLVALTNQEMRRDFRRGFLGEVPTVEEIAEKRIMKERLEILKKAANCSFEIAEERVNSNLFYIYRVINSSYGIVERVYVSLLGEGQTYRIEGRGEEVFKVDWEKTRFNPQRTLEYIVEKKGGELEYEASYRIRLEYRIDYSIPKDELSEEEMKELFEKGRQHYLEVRRYFGVDTDEGLEELIKEKSKKVEFK